MDLSVWELVAEQVLNFAMLIPRIAAMFVIFPLITKKLVPTLSRNAIFIGLSVVLYPIYIQSEDLLRESSANFWPMMLLKEFFIGSIIGFFFGSVVWAVSTAGAFVDTQTGNTMANLLDPVLGHQSSPHSRFLTQFTTVLVLSSGAFHGILEVLYSSYLFWPIDQLFPQLSFDLIEMLIHQFGLLMTLALIIFTPVMLGLALIDWCFGLINRFAQQINLLSITMPIKNWCSLFIFTLMLASLAELIIKQFAEQAKLMLTFAMM